MSESVAAAAAALGIPEPLVERSAEARAGVAGASVDDILAQWAGGDTVAPAVTAPPAEAPAVEEAEPPAEEPAAEPAAPPPVMIETPVPSAPPEPVPAGAYKPPILVGTKDSPMMVLAAVVGLFVIVVLVGLVGPSIPGEIVGARSSAIDYSSHAQHGQELYQTSGCASCHTQMVRPVIADVGLGTVTLNDTDQVLGTRRFGPDLSDVGTRLTAEQITATIQGSGGHPGLSLDPGDLDDLVAYLTESTTSTPTGEGS